jgi:hypothetical protein
VPAVHQECGEAFLGVGDRIGRRDPAGVEAMPARDLGKLRRERGYC